MDSLTRYEDGSGGEILLCSNGKRIQYAPELHQAWISTADFADEGYVNPIDPRCAGFQPPLKSIADWLKNRCEIRDAGSSEDRAGREVVRIRARVRKNHGRSEYEVTADFVPTMNYMPSRVVYYFLPKGGVLDVTDIEYQQVGPDGAWFPFKITQRCFPRNTTSNPDAPAGQNLSSEATVSVSTIGQGVQDEDFDPIIPPDTKLMGDLPTQLSSGNTPTRASQLTRTDPRRITENPTTLHKAMAAPTPFLLLVAGMDVILLGFCFMFRKRLAF